MPFNFDFKKHLGDFTLEVCARLDTGLVGVFGPSGCGKTTLLHCLAGLMRPDEGFIQLGERALFSSSRRLDVAVHRRRVGYVFQEPRLFPHMDIWANICYGRPPAGEKSFVDSVIALTGIGSWLRRRPESLSGGQKQRVALARSLVQRPDVVLMDEPMSSLDQTSRQKLILELKEIHRRTGIPMVYVSHTVSEILYLTDKVLLLEDGRSRDYGETFKVFMASSSLSKTDWAALENIYDCPVSAGPDEGGMLSVRFGNQTLRCIAPRRPVERTVRLGIRARDILLSRQPVTGISARNVLEAKVRDIYEHQGLSIIAAACGPQGCLVEVTPEAVRQLGLERGQKIYLVIKAHLITIHE